MKSMSISIYFILAALVLFYSFVNYYIFLKNKLHTSEKSESTEKKTGGQAAKKNKNTKTGMH